MSDREVEAKLVAPAPNAGKVVDALAAAQTIADKPVGPPERLELRDTYIDTPQRTLASWHGAMRIRIKNDVALLTIKGPAGDRTGPAISRAELELPFTQANVLHALDWLRQQITDPHDLPQAPAVHLQPPTIEGLSAFHDRRTERVKRVLTTTHGPVEVAIDRADYATRHGTVTLVEIEVEAIDGTPIEGVVEGARAVQDHCGPLPLRPWRHSKLSVGLALARIEGSGFDGLVDDGVLTDAGLDRVHAELS